VFTNTQKGLTGFVGQRPTLAGRRETFRAERNSLDNDAEAEVDLRDDPEDESSEEAMIVDGSAFIHRISRVS
jgi:hypothetical protein